jgi:hypothetical protein
VIQNNYNVWLHGYRAGSNLGFGCCRFPAGAAARSPTRPRTSRTSAGEGGHGATRVHSKNNRFLAESRTAESRTAVLDSDFAGWCGGGAHGASQVDGWAPPAPPAPPSRSLYATRTSRASSLVRRRRAWRRGRHRYPCRRHTLRPALRRQSPHPSRKQERLPLLWKLLPFPWQRRPCALRALCHSVMRKTSRHSRASRLVAHCGFLLCCTTLLYYSVQSYALRRASASATSQTAPCTEAQRLRVGPSPGPEPPRVSVGVGQSPCARPSESSGRPRASQAARASQSGSESLGAAAASLPRQGHPRRPAAVRGPRAGPEPLRAPSDNEHHASRNSPCAAAGATLHGVTDRCHVGRWSRGSLVTWVAGHGVCTP